MKHTFLLFCVLLFAACGVPHPVPSTTTSAPTLAPSPSLIPSISLSTIPAIIPTSIPDQLIHDTSLLPALAKTIDLGPANFDDFYADRPLALDEQAGRLYVSVSPSRTVVLDAGALVPIGEISLGGTLSVNPAGQRLYIGMPGRYEYSAAGSTSTVVPAELKLFDTTNLALLRSMILSSTYTTPPVVAVDVTNNRAYITQGGVYIADATTLDALGVVSGTFGIPGGPAPNFSAVDAAVDPARQRLWVSLNNGIPGSNNGNVLSVYDLASGQVITQDMERSVIGIAIDPRTSAAFIPHAHLATSATVKYDAQGRPLQRLENASGLVQIDAAHDRVYVLDFYDVPSLKVLDGDLNFLGQVQFTGIDQVRSFVVDSTRDRLYALLANGQLIVLKGHAQPIGSPAPVPPQRKAVQWIKPAPGDNAKRTVYVAFGPDEYRVGHGSLFRSRDAGATWEFVAGLPVNSVSSLAFGDDQTQLVSTGPNGSWGGFGVYRSTDGGQAWQPASRGLTDLGIARVSASPDFAHDRTVYALASKQGLFRSSDGGDSWTPLHDRYAPLSSHQHMLTAMALSPDFAQDHTLLISLSDGSILRSADRGETWTRTAQGITANRLVFAPDRPAVFAVTYDTLYRSDDGGSNWSAVNQLPFQSIDVGELQTSDRFVVALVTPFGQPSAIYRAPLTEMTWHAISGAPSSATAIALTPDDTLFIGANDGQVTHPWLSDLP